MQNMLLTNPEYQITQTRRGTWRRFMYPTGAMFAEFTSHAKLSGIPLIHITRGRCPETGRCIVAKGIIAVGRLAVGVIALGQASLGFIAIGQAAGGVLFGLGQATIGVLAIGQLAIGLAFGCGQFVTGYVAIGQAAYGTYVLAQAGFGEHVWSVKRVDPLAKEFFNPIIRFLLGRQT